jgi:hypothetical protein
LFAACRAAQISARRHGAIHRSTRFSTAVIILTAAGDMPTSRITCQHGAENVHTIVERHQLHRDAVFLVEPQLLRDYHRHARDIGRAGRHADGEVFRCRNRRSGQSHAPRRG